MKRWTLILSGLCLSGFALVAQAGLSPQEILAASDAVRNPDYAFGLTNTLVEYRKGKETEASTLAVYSKADPKGGQFRTLVRYVAPARDANKLIDTEQKGGLMTEDEAESAKEQVQTLTKDYEAKVDSAVEKKKADILNV